MLVPQQYVPRPGSEYSDYVVGGYAFSATLAIQDITGLATSGVTASHIAKRLEPSAESEAYLFAIAEPAGPRPVTELGFAELSPHDLDSVQAWVFVSLPLLEDRGVIEANFTFDSEIAPMPGDPAPEEPWHAALLLIDTLSARLSRPTRQIWVTHEPGSADPPALREHGYAPAFTEDQATFAWPAAAPPGEGDDTALHQAGSAASSGSVGGSVASATSTAASSAGGPAAITVVRGPGFSSAVGPWPDRNAPAGEAEQFSALLTSASQNYPRGELVLEPIEWDLKRIADAGARLGDRGGAQLTGVARVGEGGAAGAGDTGGATGAGGETGLRIVGMCEAVHYRSDDRRVCELGLVYVLPEYRGRGIGTALVRETLAAAAEAWEGLETVYCSYPAGSGAAEAMMRSLGARVVSSTTAWQKQED